MTVLDEATAEGAIAVVAHKAGAGLAVGWTAIRVKTEPDSSAGRTTDVESCARRGGFVSSCRCWPPAAMSRPRPSTTSATSVASRASWSTARAIGHYVLDEEGRVALQTLVIYRYVVEGRVLPSTSHYERVRDIRRRYGHEVADI
ncbi:MAG: hypothetical protein WKF48_09220, partial [Solirubrobacteraceae bacterium]